jgi:hypothetical protein
MPLSRLKTPAAAALASLALVGPAGCGEEEPGVDEPAREGLAIPVDGVDYNVFITRQINPRIEPDKAYYKGPPPAQGSTLYGVFVQVCNTSDEPRQPTEHFKVRDNQGEEFEPRELPEDNDFAYRPQRLDPGECIPAEGSINQLGPTAGSLLLFELPLPVTENRPLELELEGEHETKAVELDL